jgi:hypothetical protein
MTPATGNAKTSHCNQQLARYHKKLQKMENWKDKRLEKLLREAQNVYLR